MKQRAQLKSQVRESSDACGGFSEVLANLPPVHPHLPLDPLDPPARRIPVRAVHPTSLTASRQNQRSWEIRLAGMVRQGRSNAVRRVAGTRA
jgi:hypothetical protein